MTETKPEGLTPSYLEGGRAALQKKAGRKSICA